MGLVLVSSSCTGAYFESGWNPLDLLLPSQNIEKLKDLEIRYAHGYATLNPISTYRRLTATHSSRISYKSPTPLFEYRNLSTNSEWCISSQIYGLANSMGVWCLESTLNSIKVGVQLDFFKGTSWICHLQHLCWWPLKKTSLDRSRFSLFWGDLISLFRNFWIHFLSLVIFGENTSDERNN